MWFAYVESSIAWYDFDIDLVKKLISKNKRGEKTLPLEELKQPDTSFQSIDLIQENNVDRFEKKNRGPKNKNQNRPHNNQNNPNQAQKKSRPDNNRTDRPERQERPANASSNNQPKQQKPQQPKAQLEKVEAAAPSDSEKKPNPNKKKFKKKFPPKKDNNA
jgi:hypothetical protein